MATTRLNENAEAFDGARFQSRSTQEDLEPTIGTSYHGTCPNCKHFHKNMPVTLPRHPSEQPTRIQCQRCEHNIGGLGRAETQMSLASVDSFPIIDGMVHPPPDSGCINQNPLIMQVVNILSRRRGTARGDDPQPGRDRSTESSVVLEPRSSLSMVASQDTNPVERVDGMNNIIGTTGLYQRFQRFPFGFFGLSHIFNWIHNWTRGTRIYFGPRSTGMTLFGWELFIQLQPQGFREANNLNVLPERERGGRYHANDIQGTDEAGVRARPRHSSEAPRSSSDNLPQASSANNLGVPEDDRFGRDAENVRRIDHLQAFRRDNTLRRDAIHRLTCPCAQTPCPSCRNSSSTTAQDMISRQHVQVSSDSRGSLRSGSSRQLSLRDMRIEGRSHLDFAHMGANPQMQGGHSTTDNLSRATTLADSESSIAHPHPRRPPLTERSFSNPIESTLTEVARSQPSTSSPSRSSSLAIDARSQAVFNEDVVPDNVATELPYTENRGDTGEEFTSSGILSTQGHPLGNQNGFEGATLPPPTLTIETVANHQPSGGSEGTTPRTVVSRTSPQTQALHAQSDPSAPSTDTIAAAIEVLSSKESEELETS